MFLKKKLPPAKKKELCFPHPCVVERGLLAEHHGSYPAKEKCFTGVCPDQHSRSRMAYRILSGIYGIHVNLAWRAVYWWEIVYSFCSRAYIDARHHQNENE